MTTMKVKTPAELALEIGRYVDHKPDGRDYNASSYLTGSDSSQTLTANIDTKWRIWGVEGNKLLLISESLAGFISLKGTAGYNNGVAVLNDACSTAFGNPSYGTAIKARSINQDDIDKVTNMTTEAKRKEIDSNYGKTVSPNGDSCPAIYLQEIGDQKLDRSSQDKVYSSADKFSSCTYTRYSYEIQDHVTQDIYRELLLSRRRLGFEFWVT